MSQWAIVAIPDKNDSVWKRSSEKVPHMTLLFLGEQDDSEIARHIAEQLQHTVYTSLSEFGMEVDHRGVLGDKEADVLFFAQKKSDKAITAFRQLLLQDNIIRGCYDSADQFDGWTPHLTLGYPETPAKENKDLYESDYVHFDRIAFWVEDYDGPTFDMDYAPGYRKDMVSEFAPYADSPSDMAMSGEGGDFISHGLPPAPQSYMRVPAPAQLSYIQTGSSSRSFMRPVMDVLHESLAQTLLHTSDSLDQAAYLRHSDEDLYIKTTQEEIAKQLKHSVGGRASETAHIRFDVATLPNQDWLVSMVNTLEHTGTAETRIRPYADDSGAIVDYEIIADDVPEGDLPHAIRHYGVKGMKWGVRRKASDYARSAGAAAGGAAKSAGSAAGRRASSAVTSAGAAARARRSSMADARTVKKTMRDDAKYQSKVAKSEGKIQKKQDREIAKNVAKDEKKQARREVFKRPVTDDAANASKKRDRTQKHGTDALSNAELKNLVERMNLEQQYSNLKANEKASGARASGRRYVNDIIRDASQDLAKEAIKYVATEAVKSAFNKGGNDPEPSRSNVRRVYPNALPAVRRALPRGRS